MQPVLERGSIDIPLTFDGGLIQLSFIPVCSPNTSNISVKLCEGLHFSAFHLIYGPFSTLDPRKFYNKNCGYSELHQYH